MYHLSSAQHNYQPVFVFWDFSKQTQTCQGDTIIQKRRPKGLWELPANIFIVFHIENIWKGCV